MWQTISYSKFIDKAHYKKWKNIIKSHNISYTYNYVYITELLNNNAFIYGNFVKNYYVHYFPCLQNSSPLKENS